MVPAHTPLGPGATQAPGCDVVMHPDCAGAGSTLPEGDWFCPDHRQQQDRVPWQHGVAAAAGRGASVRRLQTAPPCRQLQV
jgi:hypothetical protein